LAITAITGIAIFTFSYCGLFTFSKVHAMIVIYGIAVPVFLLADDTLIDLATKNIFRLWATIALIFFLIYICNRVAGWPSQKESTLKNATNSFKALPIFLICYWILNKFIKNKTGHYIIPTLSQNTYYNYTAKRKIKWFDIVANLILLVVTIVGGALQF
jgi:hypothetical protein